jgi:general secretion pathway protein D
VPGLPGTLSGDVQIVPDETTNSLLVRAAAADWEVLRQTIAALDLRPLQVLIEVLIAEVRHTRDLQVGVSATATDKSGSSVELKGQTTGDFILKILRTGDVDVSVTLAALAARGDVRILSRPVIFAQNNQEARILVGSERPFVQVSRSLPTDAAVRDQVIQYRDVGTKLTITPTINDDGYVNLQVLQEVSTATAETQFGAPVISTREASTQLFVRNGRTAVLGGLIDRQQERSRSGIPLLMEIPVLGSLFGTTRKTDLNSELFLFLTPHIIASDQESDRAREGIERSNPRLRSVLPWGRQEIR